MWQESEWEFGACLEDGTVNKCVNLGWGVFNVAQTFSKMTGYRLRLEMMRIWQRSVSTGCGGSAKDITAWSW